MCWNLRRLGGIFTADLRRIMTFIHENEDWPNLKWDDARLAKPLADVRYRQGLLLGQMKSLGFELRAEANLKALTTEVVKSSSIEGERLSADDVRSSIARRLGMDVGGASPASRDVEGVVEMMLNATQKYAEPLTRERLFDWHAALFPTGRSGMRRMAMGKWRTDEDGPMQIVSGPIGNERVHFEAPAAQRVEHEVSVFLGWFNNPENIDQVLKAGVAHFWFVTIHPFDDGNGRMARAIADMALARAENTSERFYSASAQIEAERKQYYHELESSQRGTTNITLWLEWFLGCLGRGIQKADHDLASILRKARTWDELNKGQVNARQRKVINLLLGDFEGKLSTSKYARIARCSEDTALRDIRDLVQRGILVQNEGGGRSVSYRVSDF
jgi:Fic family protein